AHPGGTRALGRLHAPLSPLPQLLSAARARKVPQGAEMRPFSYYQERLDAVSRSFALCIPQLAPPFRDQVALSYLLLRVLDTVEDARFPDKAARARHFERLLGFLRAPPPRAEVARFAAGFPAGLTDAERALVGDCLPLLEDGHSLPAAERAV